MKYLRLVDETLCLFADKDENGNPDYPEMYRSSEELKLKCMRSGLTLLDMDVRHLGTDRNLNILKNIVRGLDAMGVRMLHNVDAKNIQRDGKKLIINCGNDSIQADKVVIAVGRGEARNSYPILFGFRHRHSVKRRGYRRSCGNEGPYLERILRKNI